MPSPKPRQKLVVFRVAPEFLQAMDARCEQLGMSRSSYILQVLRRELLRGTEDLRIVAEVKGKYRPKTGKSA